jgi:hypothetical protein
MKKIDSYMYMPKKKRRKRQLKNSLKKPPQKTTWLAEMNRIESWKIYISAPAEPCPEFQKPSFPFALPAKIP